jgi:micrococcal nuclease
MTGPKKLAVCAIFAAIALPGCPAARGRAPSVAPYRRPRPAPAATDTRAAPDTHAATAATTAIAPGTRATVAYVIDGDTIIVAARARRTRVRLLGLDAPEATRRRECFGDRATAGLRRLLPAGTAILLAVDRHRADPYGRALGYVWRADGMFINRAVLRRGYATTLFLPPAGPYRGEFAAAEALARAARAGRWRACHSSP